ncbi:MAG: glycine-rich protein [Ruminococcus sp.]|nr:glycine-rich protein [Ruminococcus sp.]
MRIHHNNISIFKRIAAVCTACCLFAEAMGTVHEINNTAFAEDTQNTFMIDQKRTLAYAGGRSYTMTLDAASYFSNGYSPASTQQSEDNYYTAPYDGKYLVQLWGGDGGDGNSFEYVSGKGGAGGYVWSIVTLEKGDVLLYNIGTKGTSTVREDTGGGVNGNGGAHGDDGSLHIGGGGGFSAVYYYPKGTFDGSIRPSEADRMSRYIMIAGGGGGGGGFELDSLFFRTNLPDGGSGGHMGTSASGVISDSAVPGTYFAGSDGKSSGTSQAYVGKGGTYKPGAAVTSDSTYILFVGNVRSNSESGNDWFRISLPDVDGGSGGAGNLNGGAGGAGYCGGSGGTMKALLNNDNTGGGGGGSSFLASAEYMTNDLSKLSESEQVMYNNSLSEKSNSSQGGYCNIAYLSSEQPNLSVYESVNFSIPVSDYFNVSAETNGNGTWNAADNTITGVDISPDKHGRENNHADITLTFTAKDTFPGGNNVPLLDGQIGMSATGVTLPAFDADKDLDKVNVPLAYTLDTFSFWHDKYTDADAPVTETELYSMNCTADSTDAYGNVISAVTMDPALTAPYNKPQATQTFDISYTVTPNEDKTAKVGPVQHERTYSGTAVVNIKEEDTTFVPNSDNLDTPTGNLNDDNSDIKIKTSRSLDYTGSSYQTVITVSASSKKVPYGTYETIYSLGTPSLYTSSTNNIDLTKGWYLVEAWGCNGGDGGDAYVGSHTSSGGAGGTGGYKSGYLLIDDTITFDINISQVPEQPSSKKNGSGTNGEGGNATIISSNLTTYLCAGGGGGGAGGYAYSLLGWGLIPAMNDNVASGENVNNALTSNNSNEWNGNKSNTATTENSSTGGTAGKNYINNNFFSEAPASGLTHDSTTNPNSGNGAVRITPITETPTFDISDKDEKKEAAKSILKNISFDLSGEWSPYFNGSTISQSNIKFDTSEIHTTEDTDKHTFTANASLEITISANPVDGFLGGNDVPLFKDDALDLKYTYDSRPSAKNIPLKNSDSLNYVNVAVAEPVFTAKDAEKFYGEDFSVHDDLIESDFSVDTESILDDFVEYELTASPSGSNDPNIGTAKASQKYTLTAVLTPETAVKATVISPVSAVQYSQEAELTVNYKVETELKNITCDADEKLPMYEDLSTTLKAESGYELPSAITVKCGDTVLSPLNGYRYSKNTGELFIPKEKINNNIKITAEAVIPTYELVFRYYTDADNSMLMEKRFAYPAGTVFDANSTWRSEFYDAFKAEEITGMAFKWNWGETGEEHITEMPAQNWFVTGKYSFNQYDLTIHYQDADGNTLAEDYKQTLLYGDEYNAASPAVANHIPQTAVVSGTIEDNTEITVIYEKIVGKLVVVYVDEDGKTVCDNHEETIDAGSTYNAVSPTITGYTPDINAVSGTMPSNGGVYQVVTYSPNDYTLAFNANGGSLSTADSSDRTVYYGKEIGWCGKEDGKYTFKALPVPIKQGSTFKGWKLNGEFVMEDTVFTLTDNAALTAEWEVDAVTLRVYYFFEDGTEAAEAVSYTETPGGVTLTSGVEFPLYNVAENVRTNIANGEHYTTQCDNTVTMGFIDKAVNVIFVGKNYTLTVMYKDEDGEISGVTDSYTVKYGTEYQHDARTPEAVNATKYDNHYASPSVIEGTMDGDTTVYVSFIRRGTVINVTVDWSSLVFEAQEVTWDPEQHFYYADSYLTEDTNMEYGTITVTNGSTNSTSIRASLSYSPEFSYENIQAKYTDRDNNTISSVVVPADESAEIRFAPQNRISFIEPGEYNVGTCVVSLSAGG